jgi:hypothetical protein
VNEGKKLMTNTFKRFIAVVVLLGALLLVRAWAAVSVYAEDMPASAVAPTAATNTPVTEGSANGSSADHPPVRIDETGVHVGGANPVDINTPRGGGDWERGPSWKAVLKSIIAIFAVFGMPVAIIAIVFYFKHRRHKMAHDTLRAMIEKGVPMTPELVAQVRDQDYGGPRTGRTRSRLLPGLVLLGTGIALLIGGTHGDSRAGWIVLFIGVAFLIVWLVEGKNPNNGQPPR